MKAAFIRTLSFCLLLSFFAAGCVSTGDLKESQKLQTSLSNYHALVIQVVSKDPNGEKFVHDLGQRILNRVQKDGMFSSLSLASEGKKGDLKLRVELTQVDTGSGAARMFNVGGEAEMTAVGTLLDLKGAGGGRGLASFDVKGNSKRKSETSIGGFNTKAFDNLTQRAMIAMSDQIAQYLKAHR